MTVAFLMCVERGVLEQQAMLLCRSIRRYAGRFADAVIHTFQPRVGTGISAETLAGLRELGVEHHTQVLNRHFAHDPQSNKIFVGAWAERAFTEETLVFVDSDTVFLNEPEALTLPGTIDAVARPVDRRRFGSTGDGDENEPYWRTLYEVCGVRDRPFVRTTVDDEPVRAYFNSGLVAVRRTAGLFAAWRENFLRLVDHEHHPANGVEFLEQIALAATLSAVFDRVHIPDGRYNYPLPLRDEIKGPLRETPLDELVHVHYHQWFNQAGFLRQVLPAFDPSSERLRWLEGFLPFDPPLPAPVIHAAMAPVGLEERDGCV